MAADLLPYLVASGAAGAVATTLVLTGGDGGGWPAVAGDVLIAAGGSGGAQPTGITDSASNTWAKITGASASPAASVWKATTGAAGLQAPGPGVTASTATITYAASTQAKQWAVMGCAGVTLPEDAAVTTQAAGTSNAPSVTSGTPAVAGELMVALVVSQNAGGTFTWAPGWQSVASNITSGTNASASVATMVSTGASPVTAGGTLAASAGWTAIVIGLKPATGAALQRGRVGGSVFKAAYSTSTDNQSKAIFDSYVARKMAMQGCKRYLGEGKYETAANPLQSVVSLTGQGIQCTVSIKPNRAASGGTAADITSLRAMLTYWKNNGCAPYTTLWNEANSGGATGNFGDGSGGIYGTGNTTATAAANYKQYFAYYGPVIISAGLQCFYNPALAYVASTLPFLPARLQADGRPLCTGYWPDFYANDTSDTYPGGKPYKVTLDAGFNAANACSPPMPVGIGELGFTNGPNHQPDVTNPAGTAQWLDEQVTAKLTGQLGAGYTVLPNYWYANGTSNNVDTATDSRIVAAIQRMYDATDPSTAAGAPALTVTTTSPLPGGTAGVPYSASLTAANGTPPYVWAVTTGTLPAGLSLASDGTLSGTPAAAVTRTFTATVTDGASATAASPSLSLAIAAATLTVPAQALPAATQGTPYATQLTASGGTAPCTWAVTTGSLPAGLSLASDGTITGTPAGTGTATFTATATDHASATAVSPSLHITVTAPAFAITTPALPSGVLGQPYTAQVDVTGATGTVTWAIISGQLPPGLAILVPATPSTDMDDEAGAIITDEAAATITQET